MKIRYRLFASLSEKAGTDSGSLDLPAGSTVQDLWNELAGIHPAIASAGVRPMVACDMEYSGWDTILDGVSEVAFLPPVSGG